MKNLKSFKVFNENANEEIPKFEYSNIEDMNLSGFINVVFYDEDDYRDHRERFDDMEQAILKAEEWEEKIKSKSTNENFETTDSKIRTSDIIDEFKLEEKTFKRGFRNIKVGKVDKESAILILNRLQAMDHYNESDYNEIKSEFIKFWDFIDDESMEAYIYVSHFTEYGRFQNNIRFFFYKNDMKSEEFAINFNRDNNPYILDRIDNTSWDEFTVDDYINKKTNKDG